jgi:glyoxylase-like metal-dependent hydrolase (beta-lactamase superfamily II)
MNEVFPGVFHIPLSLQGFHPGSVNAYLLRYKTGYIMIDTGWDNMTSLESLNTQLAEKGIQFSDIKKVIVTHCHSDHMGLINRLKRENRAVIYMHRLDMELTAIRYTKAGYYWINTDLFLQSHGIPYAELADSTFLMPNPGPMVPPDIVLDGDEIIEAGVYKLQVIHTPGHTPGHICLYEPKIRILFSGDTLLPTITTNAATHVQHMADPIQQYENALGRLQSLDVDMVLPGHQRVFTDHRKRIEEILEHYHQKSLMAAAYFTRTPQKSTAYEVARVLPWIPKSNSIKWDQLLSEDKRFAMMQTIALLEQLMFAGILTKLTRRGRIYYQSKNLA